MIILTELVKAFFCFPDGFIGNHQFEFKFVPHGLSLLSVFGITLFCKESKGFTNEPGIAAGKENPFTEVFERMDTAGIALDILDLLVQTFTGTIALTVFPAVLYVLAVMTYGIGYCPGGRAFRSSVGTDPIGQGYTLEGIFGGPQNVMELL